ncbi:unnamed protein product [Bursaphelenchus xylophilus]|uniref:(pine wood nematode) hypothetical protein n=1 Tax=Bursaphelenchus xylophilus TaxID=6326 RepID=A0A1I7S7V0_BURXY|nr:unnamed protein product [Bursaphelenchus xylophilus]CAG9087050.1 unnamed protein product [Bursaphelenchus xylophilus]
MLLPNRSFLYFLLVCYINASIQHGPNNPIDVFSDKLRDALSEKGIVMKEFKFNDTSTVRQICEDFNAEVGKIKDKDLVIFVKLYNFSAPCWVMTSQRKEHVTAQFYSDEGTVDQSNVFVEALSTHLILPFEMANYDIMNTTENAVTIIQTAIQGFSDPEFLETFVLPSYEVPIPYQVMRKDVPRSFDYKFWITFVLMIVLFGSLLITQTLYQRFELGPSSTSDENLVTGIDDEEVDVDFPQEFASETDFARLNPSGTATT